jgi:hypothetical protein
LAQLTRQPRHPLHRSECLIGRQRPAQDRFAQFFNHALKHDDVALKRLLRPVQRMLSNKASRPTIGRLKNAINAPQALAIQTHQPHPPPQNAKAQFLVGIFHDAVFIRPV